MATEYKVLTVFLGDGEGCLVTETKEVLSDGGLLGRGEVLGDGEGFLDDGALYDGEERRGRDSRLGDEERATAADCVRRMAGKEKGAADGEGGRDALSSTTLRMEGALSRKMGISEQGLETEGEEEQEREEEYEHEDED
ncbi:uncharacterized protein DS421_12g370670 [Arachis hypogaea]|nr:uncharacterized protein DS421_12g370670 [Arachis hypogaea]